jgi:hypothetical protein
MRELEVSRRDVAVRGGWLLAGVILGALALVVVGVTTDLFQDEDEAARTAAFDSGFARGAEQAREDFEREIAARETGAFARGQASVRDREEVIGLTIVQLLAAQEAGARSARAALAVDAAEAFVQGYTDGYASGYADAEAGRAPDPEPPEGD